MPVGCCCGIGAPICRCANANGIRQRATSETNMRALRSRCALIWGLVCLFIWLFGLIVLKSSLAVRRTRRFYQKPAGEIKTFFVNFLKLRNGDDRVTARLQPA